MDGPAEGWLMVGWLTWGTGAFGAGTRLGPGCGTCCDGKFDDCGTKVDDGGRMVFSLGLPTAPVSDAAGFAGAVAGAGFFGSTGTHSVSVLRW